jgi:cytoskeletal protein CcmA (bactofilin family)
MYRRIKIKAGVMEANCMKMEAMGDLIINGYGSANGGQFDRTVISGKGTVNGNLECNLFECNGSGIITGDLKSEKAKISGNAKITGNVTSIDVIVEGRGSITGNANVDKMTINGTGSIGGNVKGEELLVKGRFAVGGNCEVETFRTEGQFSVGGLLSAEHIDIYTIGGCKAAEIGGQTIKVKQKSNLWAGLFKSVLPIKLEAELIEGDHIELENTKAKIVRGNHIIIGVNCDIDLVEYKETFKEVKNGLVKKSMKL